MHTNRNKRNGFDLSACGLLFKRCFIMKLIEVFTAPTSPFRRLSASLSENTYAHKRKNMKLSTRRNEGEYYQRFLIERLLNGSLICVVLMALAISF